MCILKCTPCSCCSFGARGRITEEEEMYLSMPPHMCTLQEVIKSACGCVPISSTPHSWHGPIRSAGLLGMAPLSQTRIVTQKPSAHLSRKECVCVCVCARVCHVLSFSTALCIHRAKTNICEWEACTCASACLCLLTGYSSRHMTFRSSCFYLANPRGALTAPMEVMDDFVCTEWGRCRQMCAILQKRRKR